MAVFSGNGSAASPSFTFSGDTDTGMYLSTTDAISFTAGGTETFVIDGAGKTTSSQNVQVTAGGSSVNVNGAEEPGVFVGSGGVVTVTSSDAGRSVAMRGFEKGSTSQNWAVYSNGDLITTGFISSTAYLYMGPNGSSNPEITLDGSAGTGYFSGSLQTSSGGTGVNVNAAEEVGAFISSGGVMTITSTDAGRSVAMRGFEKGSTSQNWAVYSNGDIITTGFISSTAYLYMGPNGSSNPEITLDGTAGTGYFSGSLQTSSGGTGVNVNAAEEVGAFISSGGVMTITSTDAGRSVAMRGFEKGSTSQNWAVYSNGDIITTGFISSTEYLYLGPNGSSSPLITLTASDGTASFVNGAATIDADGTASFVSGAAIIANTGKIEVKRNDSNTTTANNNGAVVVKNAATNADSITLKGSGDATYAGTITQNASDVKFKDNVEDAPSQVDDIRALQLRTWDWNESAPGTDSRRARHTMGLVAQEAALVDSDITYTANEGAENADDEFQAIDHDVLTMKLVGALQEALTEIDTLKARLDAAGV